MYLYKSIIHAFPHTCQKNELCTGEITKGQGATSLSWATIANWYIIFFLGGAHFFLKIEPLIKNKYFQRFPPIYSYVKFAFLTPPTPPQPHCTPPTPADHDLDKLESTISGDAFIEVSNFPAKWFLRRFLKL